ncbi:MAG TPA: alpha-E domain-containing protein [Chthonomonadaceae bacterium]|nr:alpha-E domain-containing protein [Chthonomonadaceae bacterium]
MLSRDADSCYWIGRYVERAEATARMVDVHYHAALEAPLQPRAEGDGGLQPMQWHTLLEISGALDHYNSRHEEETDRDVIDFFVFDPDNPDSILATWRNARENARSIREQIASEMWESVNVTYLQLRDWNVERVLAGSPHEFFQLVKNGSHLFQGILNRTMLMSETRDWLDIGRFLERAGQTARLLDVKYHDLLPVHSPDSAHEPLQKDEPRHAPPHPYGVGGPLDMHGWIAVLKSVSAFEMYRKVHHSGISPARVVAFLLLNAEFPASVRHGIGRVEGCLKRISGNGREEPSTEPERLVGRLRADLTYSRPEEIIRAGLHEFLESVQDRCAAIGNTITRAYLSY